MDQIRQERANLTVQLKAFEQIEQSANQMQVWLKKKIDELDARLLNLETLRGELDDNIHTKNWRKDKKKEEN